MNKLEECARAELRRLADMPLSAKNHLNIQAKCPHEEIYESSVTSDGGTFINRLCLDCYKHWHFEYQASKDRAMLQSVLDGGRE